MVLRFVGEEGELEGGVGESGVCADRVDGVNREGKGVGGKVLKCCVFRFVINLVVGFLDHEGG